MDPSHEVYDRNDEKPVTKARLRDSESLATNPVGSSSGGAKDSTTGSDGGATSSTRGSGGGASDSTANRSGKGALKPSELVGAEKSSAKGGEQGSNDPVERLTRLKQLTQLLKKRKKSAVTLSIIGLIIGGLIAGFSFLSGPFEFVHIAQLMEKFHFSKQTDAENNRLEKMIRYIRDPARPERTRMGLVGNAVADNLEKKIHDSTGLSPDYENSNFKGYVADPEHPEYKGKSLEEMKLTMADRLGVDVNSVSTVTRGGVEVPTFNPDTGGWNTVKGYRAQIKAARGLLKDAGLNGISSHVSSRVLKTRAGWTFHPIQKLDSAYRTKMAELGSKAAQKLRDQLKEKFNTQEQSFVDGASDKPPLPGETDQTGTDKKGNPVSGDVNKTDAAKSGTDAGANPKESNIKGKLTGGGAAIVGVLCILKGLNDEVPKLREAKVIMPMVKLAGQFVNLGSQAQSGQDIDLTQLGLYKQFLDGTDSNGNTTSTWSQAASIQAAEGNQPKGPDLPKSAQVFNAGVPFGFVNDIDNATAGALGTACDILGSPFGFIGMAILSPVATAFQSIIVGPILDSVVQDVAGWLSGAPIDIFKGAGAIDGNYINYGSRISASEQFASAGGVQISPKQELVLNDANNSLDRAQFQSQNIAYRIFNPYDDNTLASKVIDNYGGQSATQDVAMMVRNFGSIFTSSLKNLGDLLVGTTHTFAAQPYDYHGLKAVAYSAEDLSNPAFNNPFANACAVTGGQGCPNTTGILGDPKSPNQDFIDRVKTCFGDTISPNGGSWDINFTSNTQPIDTDSDTYKGANCADSNQDWTRVRFWIMDTQTLESYDCYAGGTDTSDTSCQDVGVDTGSSNGSSQSSSSTAAASGNAQQLAQQILTNKNIDLGCLSPSVGQDVQDAANSKPGTAGAPVSSAILKLIATIGQSHKVCVTAIESNGQGHATGSYHYTGDAVDFGSIDGQTLSGRDSGSQTIMKIAEGVLPSGSAFGQSNCGSTPNLPSGWTTFSDTCNHLHVQIPRGTP